MIMFFKTKITYYAEWNMETVQEDQRANPGVKFIDFTRYSHFFSSLSIFPRPSTVYILNLWSLKV